MQLPWQCNVCHTQQQSCTSIHQDQACQVSLESCLYLWKKLTPQGSCKEMVAMEMPCQTNLNKMSHTSCVLLYELHETCGINSTYKVLQLIDSPTTN